MRLRNPDLNQSKDSYALITGASEGIGKSIAEGLAQQGYNIIMVALPSDMLHQTALDVSTRYRVKTKSIGIDLTEENSPQRVFDEVQRMGITLTILVNNAGIGYVAKFEDNPLEYYNKLIKLNALATVQLTYLFLSMLKENAQAYVLNMGSLAAKMPVPFKSVYAASKQFVRGFSMSICEELSNDGVSVTTVCPNTVLTQKIHEERTAALGWLGRISALKPDQVAFESIAAMFAKKRCIVPGRLNRIVSLFLGLLPYDIMMFLISRQIRKTLPALKPV